MLHYFRTLTFLCIKNRSYNWVIAGVITRKPRSNVYNKFEAFEIIVVNWRVNAVYTG